MNEREQIIVLAGEHGAALIQQSEWGMDFDTTKLDLESFYHAARKPLEEEIERLNVALVLARAGFSKAASGHIYQKFFEEHFEAADNAIRRTK